VISIRYAAFLRGINVGGNTLVSMAELKRAFSSLGFKNVQTVIASGNVLFEDPEKDRAVLTRKIEQKLSSQFKLKIAVILRTARQISSLIKADPFKDVKETSQTRLLVTFLPEGQPKRSLGSIERTFGIIQISNREICSAFEVAEKRGTTDLMKALEKEFGKTITTRNWNTIQRIAKLCL